jgi:hypothetical protein
MNTKVIFDFDKEISTRSWNVVDDTVMGGRSSGSFEISEDGHGLFKGYVTTENNGGFSSLRHSFKPLNVKDFSKIAIKLKGDGKDYQFRVKANEGDYYSYIASLSTSGEWEEIIIPLEDMYPSFRGRRLDMSNFSSDHIEEITFLIGNKKKEEFALLIDKIELR